MEMPRLEMSVILLLRSIQTQYRQKKVLKCWTQFHTERETYDTKSGLNIWSCYLVCLNILHFMTSHHFRHFVGLSHITFLCLHQKFVLFKLRPCCLGYSLLLIRCSPSYINFSWIEDKPPSSNVFEHTYIRIYSSDKADF